MDQSPTQTPNEVSIRNPDDANVDDLQKRAESQFIYLLIGSIITLLIGAAVLGTQWEHLQLQHVLLISGATIVGMGALLFSAMDMKSNVRGYRRYREEQRTMDRLSEKYRKSSTRGKPSSESVSGSGTSEEAPSPQKRSNPK